MGAGRPPRTRIPRPSTSAPGRPHGQRAPDEPGSGAPLSSATIPRSSATPSRCSSGGTGSASTPSSASRRRCSSARSGSYWSAVTPPPTRRTRYQPGGWSYHRCLPIWLKPRPITSDRSPNVTQRPGGIRAMTASVNSHTSRDFFCSSSWAFHSLYRRSASLPKAWGVRQVVQRLSSGFSEIPGSALLVHPAGLDQANRPKPQVSVVSDSVAVVLGELGVRWGDQFLDTRDDVPSRESVGVITEHSRHRAHDLVDAGPTGVGFGHQISLAQSGRVDSSWRGPTREGADRRLVRGHPSRQLRPAHRRSRG